MAILVCALTPFLFAGCPEQAGNGGVANQSLVEIGELSLEEGERLERAGKIREANTAYRRALWAFRYHENLTREEPLLLDDALAGIRRTMERGSR